MKKTLLIISAIALSTFAFAAGNPDKAAACSKEAVVKEACCATDGAACDLDPAACDAKKTACTLKTDAEKAACGVNAEAEKSACGAKKAATKKIRCGGCPLSK